MSCWISCLIFFQKLKNKKKFLILDQRSWDVTKVCSHESVAWNSAAVSVSIKTYAMFFCCCCWSAVKALREGIYKLLSTTEAPPRDTAPFVLSAATCRFRLAWISCTRGTLASFHSLNLSAVSSGSDSSCSRVCRSASLDCTWKQDSKWQNKLLLKAKCVPYMWMTFFLN